MRALAHPAVRAAAAVARLRAPPPRRPPSYVARRCRAPAAADAAREAAPTVDASARRKAEAYLDAVLAANATMNLTGGLLCVVRAAGRGPGRRGEPDADPPLLRSLQPSATAPPPSYCLPSQWHQHPPNLGQRISQPAFQSCTPEGS